MALHRTSRHVAAGRRKLWAGRPRSPGLLFGISTTKTAVIIAETKGAGDTFAITIIRSIPFQVRSGEDLTELLQSLATVGRL